MQTHIWNNKLPFSQRSTAKPNLWTCHTQVAPSTFAPVAIGPQMIDVIITEQVSSLLKDKRAPSVRWLTNSTQTHTLQTIYRVWCVWTGKMPVELQRGPGCHSTSSWLCVNYESWRRSSVNISRQIKMPRLDWTIKMINCGVWANVFTHVCPDCHTHTQINNGSRCSFCIILSLSHSNTHV